MKKLAALLLLTSSCLAAPKSPQQVVQDFYGQIAKRGSNYELTVEELQNAPLETNFKREMIAQRKGEYKKDDRWLIDFDLLTCMQTDMPTSAKALPAKITGTSASVPLKLSYLSGVRRKPGVEALNIHLQQTGEGWQIDNVYYSRPALVRKDALSFIQWAKEESAKK